MRGGAPILLGARPVKEEEHRQVPASSLGDRLRPGMERGICTDALMPRRSVREDDRPCAGALTVAARMRRGFPTGGWPPSPPSAAQGRVPGPDDLAEQAATLGVADEGGGQ